MKVQVFDGGVSSRLDPQLLQVNQGVVYENIDNSTGVLTPVKDKLATAIALQPYHKFFNKEQVWLDNDVPTDYLEFQGNMYYTDRLTAPQKFDGTTTTNLGIIAPASAPTIAADSATEPLDTFTTLNGTGAGDLPAADFDYMLFNSPVAQSPLSAPFKFTVYASSTTSTRALGEIVKIAGINRNSINELARFIGNTITTAPDPTNRQITFSDLIGPLDTYGQLYRNFGGTYYLVGAFSASALTIVDDKYDISSHQELNFDHISSFNGTYQYVYTYYNENDGTESAPSPVSDELTIQGGRIDITMIDSPDPQVTKKRLYRVGGDITEFTLVEEFAVGDNNYDDSLKDSELDGRLLESDNYYEAPIGLKFLSESYAMLFGVVGSQLRFTPIGKPYAWPPEYSLQFDADITSIGPVANGLIICTQFRTFLVTGTGPLSLAQQLLRGDQGCISFESMQEANIGTLIWASEDGLCTSSGSNVVSLTKNALGDVTLDPVSAIVHNEVYYIHNSDGSTLAWDYRFGQTPKWLDLGIGSLALANNELYGYFDGLLYLLFQGTENLTLKYKSPRFIEGLMTEAKTYKKVYIRSEGDIILRIIIDDVQVADFTLAGTATHQVQVPQPLQRGYSFQAEIEGTGKVLEFEYDAGARQNVE